LAVPSIAAGNPIAGLVNAWRVRNYAMHAVG